MTFLVIISAIYIPINSNTEASTNNQQYPFDDSFVTCLILRNIKIMVREIAHFSSLLISQRIISLGFFLILSIYNVNSTPFVIVDKLSAFINYTHCK